jgi:hypothetical protein
VIEQKFEQNSRQLPGASSSLHESMGVQLLHRSMLVQTSEIAFYFSIDA